MEDIEDTLINLYPVKLGENDVDTLIHMFFSRLLKGVFENFCNPPGGDWSGISIINKDNVYRYLSLPRLSVNSKRPDHVYQFETIDKPVLLAIESKETLKSLMHEKNVGSLMNIYLQDLLNRTANVRRDLTDSIWFEDNSTIVNINDYIQKSGVAFIISSNSQLEPESLDDILLETDSDLVIAVKFEIKNGRTLVYLYTKDKILFDFLYDHIVSLQFNQESQFILIDPVNGNHINSKEKIEIQSQY